MNTKIYTKNDQKQIPVTPAMRALVRRTVKETLAHENFAKDCEVSVTFTDNNAIRVLNRDFRGKDAVTDVLSFPLLEDCDAESTDGEPVALGDVVISLERALSQSQEYGHSFEREICFLTAHSVLHLLGYDHETSREDETYMNDTCEEVLSGMGLTREKADDKKTEKPAKKESSEEKRTAFVALIGRPNVGKSTLMNTIIGEKVAIVSNKPQTTRNRITGVYTEGGDQIVFLDTPGMHKPKNKLGEFMMRSADDALAGTDVILYMIESGQLPEAADNRVVEKIKQSKIPAILVINKVDAGKKDKLLLTIDKFSKLHDFRAVVPISALYNDGVDIVLDELRAFLKPERWYFPEDMLTDQTERQICAEIIREKVLRTMNDEIPHGTAVVIEDFTEGKKLVSIRAEIYCEKQAHKKMLIGKNGETLKKIATYAREDMEAFLGQKVYLDLWVKVKANWRDNELSLNRLGFKDET